MIFGLSLWKLYGKYCKLIVLSVLSFYTFSCMINLPLIVWKVACLCLSLTFLGWFIKYHLVTVHTDRGSLNTSARQLGLRSFIDVILKVCELLSNVLLVAARSPNSNSVWGTEMLPVLKFLSALSTTWASASHSFQTNTKGWLKIRVNRFTKTGQDPKQSEKPTPPSFFLSVSEDSVFLSISGRKGGRGWWSAPQCQRQRPKPRRTDGGLQVAETTTYTQIPDEVLPRQVDHRQHDATRAR